MSKLKLAWAIVALTFIVGIAGIILLGTEAQIPVHFDAAGNPDRYGSAVFGMLILPASSGLSMALVLILRRFDPRQENVEASRTTYDTLLLLVAVLMLVLQGAILLHSLELVAFKSMNIYAVLGLLFMVIGNYLPKTRSNWFLGIRTPWTLSNEEIWKKTHKLGGYMFLGCGLAILVGSLFVDMASFFPFAFALMLAAGLVPVVYSLVLWIQLEKPTNET